MSVMASGDMLTSINMQEGIFPQALDRAYAFDYSLGMTKTVLARNIIALRKHLGVKQDEFAEMIGTAQANVSKWENGKTAPESVNLATLAELAGVPGKDFVAKDWTPPVGKPEEAAPKVDGDTVDIREWDYAYGMGGGTFLDLPVTGDTHQFSRSWLRQFTHAPPTHIFLARGTGDSMSPTILDSDVVIIDTSERVIRTGDKIWAITYGEVGLIKRVRPMPDGNFKLLSDNQVVDAETAYDGEMNVVGRVVAVIRKT
jgi:phage repressor protein C with HTH and peptisase S24 domain